MRTINSYSEPPVGYDTAAEAIAAGKVLDDEYRTVRDEDIRGRIIRQFRWTDSALSLELDDGRFLNFTADEHQVICLLEDKPTVAAAACLGDDVVICFGSDSWEWRRTEIAKRYTGKATTGLCFSPDLVWLYVRDMPLLLACFHMKRVPDNVPMVYWSESQ